MRNDTDDNISLSVRKKKDYVIINNNLNELAHIYYILCAGH